VHIPLPVPCAVCTHSVFKTECADIPCARDAGNICTLRLENGMCAHSTWRREYAHIPFPVAHCVLKTDCVHTAHSTRNMCTFRSLCNVNIPCVFPVSCAHIQQHPHYLYTHTHTHTHIHPRICAHTCRRHDVSSYVA